MSEDGVMAVRLMRAGLTAIASMLARRVLHGVSTESLVALGGKLPTPTYVQLLADTLSLPEVESDLAAVMDRRISEILSDDSELGNREFSGADHPPRIGPWDTR
jgi:hypothetical protein